MSLILNKPRVYETCLNLIKRRKFVDLLTERAKMNKLSEDVLTKLLDSHSETRSEDIDSSHSLKSNEIDMLIREYCGCNYSDDRKREEMIASWSKKYCGYEESFDSFIKNKYYDDEKFLMIHVRYLEKQLSKIEKQNQLLIDENRIIRVTVVNKNEAVIEEVIRLRIINENQNKEITRLVQENEQLKLINQLQKEEMKHQQKEEFELIKQQQKEILEAIKEQQQKEEFGNKITQLFEKITDLTLLSQKTLENTEKDKEGESKKNINTNSLEEMKIQNEPLTPIKIASDEIVLNDPSVLLQQGDLKLLRSWLKNDQDLKTCKFVLLYRSSRDGDTLKALYNSCGNNTPTISIMKTAFGKVIGGYTEATLNLVNGWKPDQNAFIYSLT